MLTPFSPPPGINSDDTTFKAEGRWIDGVNVRFWNGSPQVRGGSTNLFTITGRCRAILPFTRSGAVKVAYGVAGSGNFGETSKLYVGNGIAAPTARTPAGLTNNEKNWSLAPWGDTLLACPEGGTLYDQSGTSTAAAVSAAPDAITYMLVTPQRQVLAFGCNEEGSGTFNGLCIRGSDLEDYTDWTTSSANNAFEHILGGSSDIVAAKIIGEYVAVWTTGSLYLGQFIGDPGQAYRFDLVAQGCGLVGPNAVVIIDMTAFWMSPDLRVRSWSPGAIPAAIPCSISRDLTFITTAMSRYVVASANPRFNEVRFDFFNNNTSDPYPVGTLNNFFASVNLSDGAWWKGNDGRTAVTNSGALLSLTGGYLDNPTILAADENGNVFLEENDTLAWVGAMNPYIRSGDIYLDNSQRRVMIRSVIPDLKNQVGDALITLFMRDRPESTSVTKGPYTLTTSTTKKDFRASGKIVSVKISGSASSSYFRIGKPLFDIVPTGER